MKKLFTIIAVASMMLTSVFGFTSCQKDELPAPQKTYIDNNNNNNVVVTSVNTQYDNNSSNTNKNTAAATATDPFSGMSGTWEYVDADGNKCTLELSNETKSTMPFNMESNGKTYTMAAKYQAKLTVGSMTYIGKFYTGIFLSNDGGATYSLSAQKYISSVSANSFNADIKVYGKLTSQGVTLTKVK